MRQDNNHQAFFALLRAGLWEQDVRLVQFGDIDYSEVYRLAKEQSVVGLVAAGIEHVIDEKVSKEDALVFAGNILQLEQRNQAMDIFIGDIVEKMRKEGICTLLLKGQGVAQCYAKPLWRASGDIDFFLSEDNYRHAKEYLGGIASSVDEENAYYRHIAMTISSWTVELHGSLRGGLWRRLDRALDEVQKSVFYEGNVRSWIDGHSHVFLPREDEDTVYIFSHILQHFFLEGIGLRQICDWCRLLWTYQNKLDKTLLKKRLDDMGVMTEWYSFAALAVKYLGMPAVAMPFYDESGRWERKADKIMDFVLETGNFGHNRDYSYQNKYPYYISKIISLGLHIMDFFKYYTIFPIDSIKVMTRRLTIGIKVVMKGKKHE